MKRSNSASTVGLVRQLQETDDRSRANKRRIDALEEDQKALTQIAKSGAVMANEQKNISSKLDSVDSKVDELEHKPAKRWDSAIEKVLMSVLAALTAWMLAKVGIV